MNNLAFAFDNLNFSDTILHVEIESEIVYRKDFLWLKSFIKQIRCGDFFQVAPGDVPCSTQSVKVRTLNVSSTILSSESLYFYKRFKEDDTKELQKKELTLKIKDSEEAALVDLLNFMYINNLSATMPHQLESVRMMAEKLEVTSCIRYVNKLSKALQHEVYSGEPSCASMAEAAQPLKDAAKKDLLQHYMDLSNAKSREVAMGLPLCALEIVLGSPGVRVYSEGNLYAFILEWVDSNCSGRWTIECIKVKEERLSRFIHFPYISRAWHFHDHVHLPLIRALAFNDGTLYRCSRKIERTYLKHPICEVGVDDNTVAVYFFLTKKVLDDLFVLKKQSSVNIGISRMGSEYVCLLARCGKVKGGVSDHFGLLLWNFKRMPDGFEFDYEFSALTSKGEYRTMSNGDKCSFSSVVGTEGSFVGDENLFGVTWADLMAQDSEFLVDGTLHLRVKITTTARPSRPSMLSELRSLAT